VKRALKTKGTRRGETYKDVGVLLKRGGGARKDTGWVDGQARPEWAGGEIQENQAEEKETEKERVMD